jgi:hypothetical protein
VVANQLRLFATLFNGDARLPADHRCDRLAQFTGLGRERSQRRDHITVHQSPARQRRPYRLANFQGIRIEHFQLIDFLDDQQSLLLFGVRTRLDLLDTQRSPQSRGGRRVNGGDATTSVTGHQRKSFSVAEPDQADRDK